jgi:hypothetical protein
LFALWGKTGNGEEGRWREREREIKKERERVKKIKSVF